MRVQLLTFLPVGLRERVLDSNQLTAGDVAAIQTHLEHLVAAFSATVPGWLQESLEQAQPIQIKAADATLLFADVIGSTSLTAQHERRGRAGVERLISLLNHLFDLTVGIALSYGGDLLVFGGDAILVAFTDPDHSTTAAMVAQKMQAALAASRQNAIGVRSQFAQLRLKIGVASGPLLLTNVGSTERRVALALGRVLQHVAAKEHVIESGRVRPERTAAADLEPVTGSTLRLAQANMPHDPRSMQESGASISCLLDRLVRLNPYLPAPVRDILVAHPSGSPGDGEQRQVITLFSQLVGLHTLADVLGPTQAQLVAELVGRVLDQVVTVIEAHGGVVARVDTFGAGHKVLALFGAPKGQEHPAQRAVQAALALRDAIGELNADVVELVGLDAVDGQPADGTNTPAEAVIDAPVLALRSALNAGLVVSGLVGSPRRYEYTVMGDAVNVAARLMGAADLAEDEVLIGAPLYEQLHDHLESSKRLLSLLGMPEPVPAWSVHALRNVPTPRSRASAKIAGREDELRLLQQAVSDLRSGAGALVFVEGEAGIGKTRLVTEFVAAHTTGIRALHTGSPGLVPAPYSLFHALLRTIVGLAEGEPPALVWDGLRQLLDRQHPHHSAELWPALGNLLGLPDADPSALGTTPEAVQRVLVHALHAVIEAARPPLVWVCEDLHQADDASLALLDAVLRSVSDLPLLVVATLRPLPDQPTTAEQDAHRLMAACIKRSATATRLRLTPLEAGTDNMLLDMLLPDVAPATRSELLAHAGGNPLFLEVLTQTLLQQRALRHSSKGWVLRSSLADLAIPLTLDELITAQIDRLPPEVRRLAQAAAVIAVSSPSFPAWLLEHVADQPYAMTTHLRTLLHAGLIQEVAPAIEQHYTFRHALFRRTSYTRLLERDRRALHRRAGLALHELGDDDREAYLGALAYHTYEGQIPDLAAQYGLLAGQQAQRLYANRAARQHLRRALDVAQRLRNARHEAAAREGLGELYALLGRYNAARRELEHALRLGEAAELDAEQQETLARRHRLLAVVHERTGDYAAAEAQCRSGLGLIHGLDQARIEAARLYAQLAEVVLRRNGYAEAEQACLDGLTALADLDAARERVVLLQRLASLDTERGRYREANAALAQSLAHARDLRDPALIGLVLHNLGNTHVHLGQYDQALACYQESMRLKEGIDDTAGRVKTTISLGLVYLARGDADEALRSYTEAYELSSRRPAMPASQAIALNNIGRLHYEAGRLADARTRLLAAHGIFEALGDVIHQADCLYVLGDIALAEDDPDAAWNYGQQALELARRANNAVYESCALRVVGEALLALGQLAAASVHLERAALVQERVGDPCDQALIMVAQARLVLDQGNGTRAKQWLLAALALAREQCMDALATKILALLARIEEP